MRLSEEQLQCKAWQLRECTEMAFSQRSSRCSGDSHGDFPFAPQILQSPQVRALPNPIPHPSIRSCSNSNLNPPRSCIPYEVLPRPGDKLLRGSAFRVSDPGLRGSCSLPESAVPARRQVGGPGGLGGPSAAPAPSSHKIPSLPGFWCPGAEKTVKSDPLTGSLLEVSPPRPSSAGCRSFADVVRGSPQASGSLRP
jgi:hypothetical protein